MPIVKKTEVKHVGHAQCNVKSNIIAVPFVSSIMSYHTGCVTLLVPLVEWDLLILPEHFSSSPCFALLNL